MIIPKDLVNKPGGSKVKVVQMVENLSKELADELNTNIISMVAYGRDIQKDIEKASDYSMLIAVEELNIDTHRKVQSVLKNKQVGDLINPLIIQSDEIEGMMDSVPETFIDILLSYQTVYGKPLFKGLAHINQEHLRAQTERSLREYLFESRILLMKGLRSKKDIIRSLYQMKDLLCKSIKIYHVLSKPWITEDSEHRSDFFQEFPEGSMWIKKLLIDDLDGMTTEDLEKIAFSVINEGIKPILFKVDEMGP